MARHTDAALVFVSDQAPIAAKLPAEAWDPRAAPDVRKGLGVVLGGAPGEWKSEPDVERRAIDFMKTLLYWTAVTNPNEGGLIMCDVDESNHDIPKSFKGMSGGPALDIEHGLVGVNMGERRTKPDGIMAVTPRQSWTDLFYPFELPAGAPEIFGQRMAFVALDARDIDGRRDQTPIRVTFIAEFFRSPDHPDHQYGTFGRVVCVLFGTTPDRTRYRVNLESVFFPASDKPEDWKTAFHEEAAYILDSMDYEDVTAR